MKKIFKKIAKLIKYLRENTSLIFTVGHALALIIWYFDLIYIPLTYATACAVLAMYFFLHYRFDLIDNRDKRLLDLFIKVIEAEQKKTVAVAEGMTVLNKSIDRLR